MKDKLDIINRYAENTARAEQVPHPRGDLTNRNRLSWWFPKIPDDIPTPKTEIIYHDGEDLLHLMDHKIPGGFRKLCHRVIGAGDKLGWPLFLRTDFLSGKHGWKETCCIQSPDKVILHIIALVQESALADIVGFPMDYWIAREMIPTKPAFYAFHGNMPIVKERRYFVYNDQVMCHHPYWPIEAFEHRMNDISSNWRCLLDEMNVEDDDEIYLLSELSSRVGRAIGGDWSIDWLWSEPLQKWFLTDMASAIESYHWMNCIHNKTWAK